MGMLYNDLNGVVPALLLLQATSIQGHNANSRMMSSVQQ